MFKRASVMGNHKLFQLKIVTEKFQLMIEIPGQSSSSRSSSRSLGSRCLLDACMCVCGRWLRFCLFEGQLIYVHTYMADVDGRVLDSEARDSGGISATVSYDLPMCNVRACVRVLTPCALLLIRLSMYGFGMGGLILLPAACPLSYRPQSSALTPFFLCFPLLLAHPLKPLWPEYAVVASQYCQSKSKSIFRLV
ncbi:hypothetical protein B0T17DRAFT_505641 [Bombardia bombarda]|uniref:Uncharacterized protein n=1 Tax=Bombardia bombarda TaxID=252184 RepID=A0AA39X826_9PEZI|nr:hypothetical protein B0T17DRAFT_505641 [Bombardia bombarda]